MKFVIIAVGHRAPDWVTAGFTEYARRMPPESRIELVDVKAEPRDTGKTAEQMMAAEARRIHAAVPAGATLVALDEHGRDVDTRALAKLVQGWQRAGGDVAFAIGGADGLHADVKAGAATLLRISSLTLPHALVRVLLAETLYRAVSLGRGHPYHRE